MSDIARLLHYVERKNSDGVENEIAGGADVNQREPVRRRADTHARVHDRLSRPAR
jgi:hypothetical protein